MRHPLILPKYYLNTINGHPAIHTQSAWFNISDSATAFDAWDSMTFFITWKWNGGDYWHAGLRKHNAGNGNNQSTGFSFDRMNVGAGQSTCVVVGYRLCGDPINWLPVAWMRMTQRLLQFGTMVHPQI